ncbi:rod shape-determining protein MreD [Fluviibacterium sp. DFM31]|uniref:Rod shape-determining protein MreD n=1 Tax=Meridianimarinicoccus marinus TaxID=3231483 RepID=A0ABV3L501_9RHOB
MSEGQFFKRLMFGGLFVLLCAMVIMVKLLPLDLQPGPLPTPDLVICLVVAWVIRRPDGLPVWLIAAVVFVSDLLLMQPPGLWTAIAIGATEYLRRRHKRLQPLSVLAETGVFAALYTAMVGLNWLALTVTFADQPSLGAQLLRMPVTVAAYPFVVLLCAVGLGLRKRPVPEGFGRGSAR